MKYINNALHYITLAFQMNIKEKHDIYNQKRTEIRMEVKCTFAFLINIKGNHDIYKTKEIHMEV